MPVILWTDFLVFTLLIILLVAIYFGAKNAYVCARWAKVYNRPSRIIAFIVLVTFMLLGLLDSMHFSAANNASNMRSMLDVLLTPISIEVEQSYSAPFATELFIKTMHKDELGQITWVAEPLQYVQPVPVLQCLWIGLITGLCIFAAGTILLWLYFKKVLPHYNYKNTKIGIAWATVGCITMVFAICAVLIRHYHILGTDKIGVDVFYSAVKSIRTGLILGTLTTMLTLPFAVIFGAMAGYYRGVVDDIIQYIYTTLSSIPGVLLIAAAMLSMDAVIARHVEFFATSAQLADVKLLMLCTILGITSWTSLCRLLRGETLKLRDQGFVVAAQAIGLNSTQIITKHIFPNLLHIILIALILDFSGLVLAESVLTYVGVGVDASMYSWGNMINSARMEMGRDPVIWWSLCGAFIMMFILVLSANIFADGVRDAFDPKAK